MKILDYDKRYKDEKKFSNQIERYELLLDYCKILKKSLN